MMRSIPMDSDFEKFQANLPNEPNQQSEIPTPNLIQKIIWVFSNPFQLGQHLKHNPTWLIPILLNIMLIIPLQILIYPQTALKMEEEIRKSFDASEISIGSEKQEQIVENAIKFGKYTTPLFSALSLPFAALLSTLIWLFVGNLLIGGEAKFRELYSATAWTLFIMLLGGWVKAPVILLQNTVDVTVGPAVFLGNESSPFLKTFLYGMDFFYIWQVIAQGIAVAAIYNWTKSKGIITGIIIYLFVITVISTFA